MVNFSSKQKEVLEIAKSKGFISHGDIQGIFSSPIARKANIERFLALGILIFEQGVFKLNSDKLKELNDVQTN